jgi:aerobic-type carbon monoxide dehydrogenase small subunit (CoxS/CutS family)
MAEGSGRLVLRVNGAERQLDVDRSRSLLSVLRTELGLTGTKYGCGAGECGACTVLLEDRAVRSCTTPVGHAAGRSVITIEGLEKDGGLHPVQEAFIETQAFLCGYCTPAMIMGAVALLRANPSPSGLDIREAMSGYLCRCGSYHRIIRAIQLAAARMRGEER